MPIIVEQASSSSPEDSPAGVSPLITVKPLHNYDTSIPESDDESRSSHRSSKGSEYRRRRELAESNVFLLKVIHGNVPNEFLASNITSADRENLSTLIPVFGSRDAP